MLICGSFSDALHNLSHKAGKVRLLRKSDRIAPASKQSMTDSSMSSTRSASESHDKITNDFEPQATLLDSYTQESVHQKLEKLKTDIHDLQVQHSISPKKTLKMLLSPLATIRAHKDIRRMKKTQSELKNMNDGMGPAFQSEANNPLSNKDTMEKLAQAFKNDKTRQFVKREPEKELSFPFHLDNPIIQQIGRKALANPLRRTEISQNQLAGILESDRGVETIERRYGNIGYLLTLHNGKKVVVDSINEAAKDELSDFPPADDISAKLQAITLSVAEQKQLSQIRQIRNAKKQEKQERINKETLDRLMSDIDEIAES